MAIYDTFANSVEISDPGLMIGQWHFYTAVTRLKDLNDKAPLSLFQLYHLQQSMSLNDTPNEPSLTQAEDDNSFDCPLPRLTDLNAGHLN